MGNANVSLVYLWNAESGEGIELMVAGLSDVGHVRQLFAGAQTLCASPFEIQDVIID